MTDYVGASLAAVSALSYMRPRALCYIARPFITEVAMSCGLHAVSIPVFTRMLGNLSTLLDKAVADAEARKFDPSILLESRLSPDMFPLTRQVQLACDFAKGAAARLSGAQVPAFPDEEKTVPELKARIEKVIAFCNSMSVADVDAGVDRDVTIKMRDRTVDMKGLVYLNTMAMPNFWFHVTTAYAILRHNGVAIGKRDFVGV